GDIADRGPDCLKIYKLFDRLRLDAKKVDISTFGTIQNRIREFSSEGYIGNLLLTTFQIASIVENDTLFVHGGIDLNWAKKGIENINILGKELVSKTTKMLSKENPIMTWDRMNVTKEEASIIDIN
ncbi:5434_t:CDS:2, partial [Scutellospora calospora]